MTHLPVCLIVAQLTGDVDVLNQITLIKEQSSQHNDIAGLDLSLVLLALVRILWCNALQSLTANLLRSEAGKTVIDLSH